MVDAGSGNEADVPEPPPPPLEPEPGARSGYGVAVVLAAAALIAAIIGGRAAFRSFAGTTLRQQSVREQTKQAAAYVETLRFAYTSEQPLAFLLSEARFRAEELGKVAAGLSDRDRAVVELEQAIQAYISSGQLAESSPLFNDPRYQGPDGFDIARRIVDLRNEGEGPELLKIDPEKTQAAGDHASRHAIRLATCTVLLAIAFLFGALGQGFPRRRQLFLGIGVAFLMLGSGAAVVVEVVS